MNDIALNWEAPFAILQYNGFTYVLLYVLFIFVYSKECLFVGSTWWSPFVMEIICIDKFDLLLL